MPRVALQHQVVIASLLILSAFAFGIAVVVVATVHSATPHDAGRTVVAASADWSFALRVWAYSLLPSLLVARLAGHWVASQVDAPMNRLIECSRAIRKHGAPWTFPTSDDERVASPVALALNDLMTHFTKLMQHQHQCLADAAHELRTPLTAQVVVAENALARAAADGDLREPVVSMLEESRYMQRLIENVLLLKRASAVPHATSTVTRVEDLSALVQTCVSTLQVLAEEKGQALTVDLCGPLWSRVEPTMVRQAILNVVHNAIEHCPTGTRIGVRTVRAASGRGIVIVADDGQGIAKDERAHVFASFFRGSRTSRRRGLGLGLAIAKAAVIAQGGSIRLRTAEGEGCRFDLEFPLTARAEDHVARRARLTRVREAKAASRSGRSHHDDGFEGSDVASWLPTMTGGFRVRPAAERPSS